MKRRNFLTGGLVAAFTAAAGAFSPEASNAATMRSRAPSGAWHTQPTSGIREASREELAELTRLAKSAAVGAGHPEEKARAAASQATMSETSRGTEMGRCVLTLEEGTFFLFTKEFGTGNLNRDMHETLQLDDRHRLHSLTDEEITRE